MRDWTTLTMLTNSTGAVSLDFTIPTISQLKAPSIAQSSSNCRRCA
jgi:hypothetical protein